MKVMLFPEVDSERLAQLKSHVGPGDRLVNVADEDRACEEIVDADALIGRITPRMLRAAGRLRWVQAPTASLEHYLFPELIDHPCLVTNMRGLFSDVIADQVFGYLLCFTRNLHQYIRQQLSARWAPIGGEDARVSFATGPAYVGPIERAHRCLSDLTMGIVGMGAIGLEIARRATSFQMRVVAADPRPMVPSEDVAWVVAPDKLELLLAESDVVVIAAPHTPETEGLFRRPQFERMKRSAYLINIGRGAIVDLNDLTDALEEELIAGAGLDVFEVEPLPSDHPLWRLPNAIITPHVAGYSPRIAERHLAVLIENISRFGRDEPLINLVDKKTWC
ncbi:Glyoxylate/hydroxypyruvate reductase B [Planctomycetes bacterium Pan216]|uniref:Glyoxylate/hydroxypyruvate reductase B n=1 Tax=Kolteria novifilia TaxID=2527975 RepID=A0A518B5V1_9BACT|nr:Glyoxylate/hydroxypyruvate reductase B [Planctomycetes bacterium Pan216]